MRVRYGTSFCEINIKMCWILKKHRLKHHPDQHIGLNWKSLILETTYHHTNPWTSSAGADGKYTCIACKKSFLRERHFLTHRCMSIGDYVDLSRKDALGSDDDESEEETDEDKDKTVEFR